MTNKEPGGHTDSGSAALHFLSGGGEMGELIRSADWEGTSLGHPSDWPQSLRSAASIMLNSRYPIALYWGGNLALIYNDAWRPILGSKHPWALGRSARDVWPEIWETIGPLFDQVFASGEGTWSEDELLPMRRHGYTEECYFNFTFSPVRGEAGRVEGIFNAVVETTERVLSERRLATLSQLGAQALEARDTEEACRRAAGNMDGKAVDLPFALIYLIEGDSGAARLAATTDPSAGEASALLRIPLDDENPAWPLAEVARTGQATVVAIDEEQADMLPSGPWPEPCTEAIVLPLAAGGKTELTGFLIAGINPRRRLDAPYRTFFELAAGHVATAINNARAYEAERKRADTLAQLDRAKTTFFSNVSHEFRTPLTLMLGPLEEALADRGGSTETREQLQLAHQNARRLLKLVNSLLDFSRIEAGRAQASFEPTDLAELTADLASNFRSACDRAGLALRIDCPPLADPAFVDRDMWEKIVLNLLSNAFKFTLEGRIVVTLGEDDGRIVLDVRDTGSGIPEQELPRLFERFHRVEGTRGRTYEGSGIGLALVRELVHLHGGTIAAQSEPGKGTRFTVRLPKGSSHLPAERIRAERTLTSTATDASVYVEEALRWLPAGEDGAAVTTTQQSLLPPSPTFATARILFADDSADMRDYVSRLLVRAGYEVKTVTNGATALEQALREPPDLVLADIMMPVMDGFELLHTLRGDSRTKSLPVILLSARAGEEARAEGLEAGADDYVTKPFSARDLLARVASQVRLAAIRREGELAFRTIADAAPAMLWITDQNNACIYLSRGWREYTGQQDTEGLGVGWLDAVHPADRERATQLFLEAAARREGFAFDHRLQSADGSYRWAIDAGHPRFSDEGEFLGYIGSVMDVHERKLAEESLRDADRRKDEFIAMLGHELRNPLAAIRNTASLVALSEDPRLESAQAILDRQTTHMARLVDGLLDVSRIARGKIDLTNTTADLRQLIASVVEARDVEAKAKEIELNYDAPAESAYVVGDTSRLNQVFDNILGNAIKFSERDGRVDIRLERVDANAVVTVSDTGPGIGADMLEAIFEPFRQGHQDYARAAGGIGLGLALVKTLVTLHRGEVSAMSDGPGLGASFRVVLPCVEAPVDVSAVTRNDEVNPQRVLLVEDNNDAAQALAALLAMRGHRTSVATTAPEGLALLRQQGADIVLCDIGLPGMSGYDFARAVRADDALRDIKLVAVTGYGQPEDREHTRKAGFDGHLTKPVEVASLDAVFRDAR